MATGLKHSTKFTSQDLFEKYSLWPSAEFNETSTALPYQKLQVLRIEQGKLQMSEMRWGFVPSWAKSVKDADKYSLLLARFEELSTKKSYSESYRKRRCIIPISGYYDWSDKSPDPKLIQNEGVKIASTAGIWERWLSEDREVVDSFALITVSATDGLGRMPMIVDDEGLWLAEAAT